MYPLTIIVWPYRKLRNRPIELECFFTIHWQVTTFEMIAGSSSISFKCIWNKLYSWAALLKFWFQTDLGYENSAGFYMQGRQSLLTFLTIVTRWSRSSSNLNALIGQNLRVSSCGKFMQHLETSFLMAQADRVLCRHLSCFWLSFSSGCTKWIQLLLRFFCNSWVVCLLGLWLRNAPLVKIVGNPISSEFFVCHRYYPQ